jgi:ADP-heptose:LPS heptosyltransferase
VIRSQFPLVSAAAHSITRGDPATSPNELGPQLTKFPHRRCLLVVGSHVGSNIFCTPAIGFLKKHLPEVRFDVVTPSRRGASVFANNPHIDRLYRMRSKWRVRRLAEKYDLAIGLQWDKARDYLSGARIPTIVIGEPPHDRHRADATLEFAQKLVGRPLDQSDRHYVLCPAPSDFATIGAQLAGVRIGEILVGFHLGTGRTELRGWQWFYRNRAKDPRIWPVAEYAAVARRLREINPNIRSVLTGTRNERFLARAFSRTVPDAINLVGKTSLLELAALMRHLSVFVTNDNGALHVASAADLPVVGLFGPTVPERTGMFPPRPNHFAIRRPTIEEIDSEEVCAAVVRLLPSQAARPAEHRD